VNTNVKNVKVSLITVKPVQLELTENPAILVPVKTDSLMMVIDYVNNVMLNV